MALVSGEYTAYSVIIQCNSFYFKACIIVLVSCISKYCPCILAMVLVSFKQNTFYLSFSVLLWRFLSLFNVILSILRHVLSI